MMQQRALEEQTLVDRARESAPHCITANAPRLLNIWTGGVRVMMNTLNVVLVLSLLSPAVAGAYQDESSSNQSSAQAGKSPASSGQAVQTPQSSAGQAAQSPQASGQTARSSSGDAIATIDCPPAALAKAEQSLPSSSPIGTPGGTGSGSGAEALPGKGQVQRVEGSIKTIDSSRTSRAIEVGGVKLWVEPSTPVLLDCQKASVADLKQGTPVKAMYEEKAGRNVAKIVEAKKP